MVSKKEKAGKSKKGKSSTDRSSLNTDVSSIKSVDVDPYSSDPSFHKGNSKFSFPNGDKYDGEFCAHLSGLVWREGIGTYTTAEGQVYKGRWDGDKLVENQDIEILYPDGTQFFGNIFKNKYTGPGICHLEEKVSLVCDFSENKPLGDITLIDPNEKVWHGVAEKNDALLLPEHVFYKNIPQNRGKCRSRESLPKKTTIRKDSIRKSQDSKIGQQDQDEEVSKRYADWRWLEEKIFAKHTLDDDTIKDFENSEWYRDYAKFRETYEPFILKAKEKGEESLNFVEKSWYTKYKEFEQNYSKTMQKMKLKKFKQSTSIENMFQLIHSKEYKKTIKPVPVFQPSANKSEENCEDLSCLCE